MPEPQKRPKEPASSNGFAAALALAIFVALALVVVFVLLMVNVAHHRAAERASSSTEAIVTGAESGDAGASADIAERAVGETLEAGGFAIRVVSFGPSQLPPGVAAPAEGMVHVAVRAVAVNQGDAPVALNGIPYKLYQTSLRIDGKDYPGSFISGTLLNVRDGMVPPATELTVPFLFEVPEGSHEATFTWLPRSEDAGYPTLVVPIADISAGSD